MRAWISKLMVVRCCTCEYDNIQQTYFYYYTRNKDMTHNAVADLGGAHPARAPFETFFYNCPPPPSCLCAPPPFETINKKKQKCVGTQKCVGSPPPPPVWDLRDSRRWWRSGKKKCWSLPDTHQLISFFGTCATFEAGGGPEQCCAPLFYNPGSAPA